MNNPSLTEPGVKSFLHHSLKECKKFKNSYYNVVFNISTFILSILGIVLILIYRYNGGITKEARENQNRKKQEYIFKKLQFLSATKKNENLITDLPVIENNPELNMLNRKIY